MRAVKGVVWAVCVAYFLTSAVVVANAFVWLPTLPSAWYKVQAVLYWPFRSYLGLAASWLGSPRVPYWAYAVLTYAPFLALSAIGMLLLARRRQFRVGGSAAGARV